MTMPTMQQTVEDALLFVLFRYWMRQHRRIWTPHFAATAIDVRC